MCTVTYIPISGGFILSSNRDESPDRSPKNLTRLIGAAFNLSYPQDTLAGGTWIAADNRQRVLCLLNGAFKKHQHLPPYKMSRGILALEYFNYNSVEEFRKFDFNDIEPLTSVVLENNNLYEIRWDGKVLHFKKLDAGQTHIWSSCTLYSEATQKKREALFEEWKKTTSDHTLENINRFHNFSDKEDPENTIVMNRSDIVKTVSITNIKMSNNATTIYYNELQKKLKDEQTMINQTKPV